MTQFIIRIGLACLFGTTAFAQSPGRIKIVQPDHKPISGAVFTFPDWLITLSSDTGGWILPPQLPAGRNLFILSAPGYGTVADSMSLPLLENREIELKPWVNTMKEVVILGHDNERSRNTPFQISVLTTAQMRRDGSFTLTDAMAKLPGVFMMGTGPFAGKPIVRGLYGTRVQVLLLGMRFDNQQWQDEHGLGLNDMGTQSVEVLRGPAAVFYGPDAVGGVIQVIEEQSAPEGKMWRDMQVKTNTNTGGAYVDVGWRKNTGKKQYRLRMGGESHADYQDGNGQRILNTRLGGWQVKGSYSVRKKTWICVHQAMASLNRFGFLNDSLNNGRKMPDARFARVLDGPFHQVLLGVYTGTYSRPLPHGKLTVETGYAGNWRMENEGGKAISINMILNSLSTQVQRVRSLKRGGEWVAAVSALGQYNLNIGSRFLIPDAYTGELGASFVIRYPLFTTLRIEGGLRTDTRLVQTLATGNLNPPKNQYDIGIPGTSVIPFSRAFQSLNGSTGLSWIPNSWFTMKLLLSTGFRPPNLAELSSNGLHEGTMRWEIGNPQLNIERNVNSELSAFISLPQFQGGITGFINQFQRYIYLQSTGKEYLGFQIFEYLQHPARLMGGELFVMWKPLAWSGFEWSADYSYVRGRLIDADHPNLPFVPSPRWKSQMSIPIMAKRSFTLQTHVSFVHQQAYVHPGAFETTAQAYGLWHAGLSGTVKTSKHTYVWSMQVQNLTNSVYMDPLSRFRYYGINNMGRNIYIHLNIPF